MQYFFKLQLPTTCLEVHHLLQVVLKEAEEAMTDLNVEEKEDTGEAAVDVVEVVEKASIVNEVTLSNTYS